ncbi:hypothetical protein FB45DRAFT_892118 [Roridomyces roridus]|uniref:BTB domain-containing protein n=1 Tax=Roridomyces roridus TaxID=1738132 RepID=A0AAD7CF25_9AGAR|nr:hypothetical protein FB45DRAFT_892118 [Roridomyces roridus]
MTFRDALPPFSRESADEFGSSDLILRSSDSVDFHTHKTLLAFASPIFRELVASPSPTHPLIEAVDAREGTAVIQLSEPSDALCQLLLLCYPQAVIGAFGRNLDGLCDAYGAAEKYKIPGGKPAVKAAISKYVEDEPYRVYAIACHLELPDLAKSAALETLDDYFLPTDGEYDSPEFAHITAAKLLQLRAFHVQCGVNAANIVKGIASAQTYDAKGSEAARPWWILEGHQGNCGPTIEQDTHRSPAPWFRAHMATVGEVVKSRPNGAAAAQAVLDYTNTLRDISKCGRCCQDSAEHMATLAERVRQLVEDSNTKTVRATQFVKDKSWFSGLSKRTATSMHQLLRTSEDETRGMASMKWDVFVKLMTDMGFQYVPSTSGSSVRFDPPNPQDVPITFHKPYPDSTIHPIMLREFAKKLKKSYGWIEADFLAAST